MHRPTKYQEEVHGPLTVPNWLMQKRIFMRVIATTPGRPPQTIGPFPSIMTIMSFVKSRVGGGLRSPSVRKRARCSCLIFESLAKDRRLAGQQFKVIARKEQIESKESQWLEAKGIFLICLKVDHARLVADCLSCDVLLHHIVPFPTSRFFWRTGLAPMLSYLKNYSGANEEELQKLFDHAIDKVRYLEGHRLVRQENNTGGERVWKAESAADRVIDNWLRALAERANRREKEATHHNHVRERRRSWSSDGRLSNEKPSP